MIFPVFADGLGLRELEDAGPAAAAVVLDGSHSRVRVAGLVEEELGEVPVRPEHPVLGPFERRAVRRHGGRVRVEGALPSTAVSWIVTQRVSNDWPYVCSATWSGDMTGVWDALVIGVCARVQHLQDLQPAVCEVAGRRRDVAVDEAVRDLRRGRRLVRAADVLDDPDVAVGVVLDALVAAASERAGDVGHVGGVAGRGRVGRRARVLGREQQPLREWIPGRAVDVRDRVAVRRPESRAPSRGGRRRRRG